MVNTSVPGTCATCEYYWYTRKACRRNPPQAVVLQNRIVTTWPEVDPAHWCGEYEESYDVKKRDTTGAV